MLAILKKLQDALGDVNDVAVQAGLKGEIIGGKGGKSATAKNQHRAFASGLIIGHQKARLESLMNSAEDAFSDFKDAKTFWKGFDVPAPRPGHDHPASEASPEATNKPPQAA